MVPISREDTVCRIESQSFESDGHPIRKSNALEVSAGDAIFGLEAAISGHRPHERLLVGACRRGNRNQFYKQKSSSLNNCKCDAP